MTLLLGGAVRVALIVLGALVVSSFMCRRSAAARHWVLAVGLLCATAMPLLVPIAPKWTLPPSRVLEFATGDDVMTFTPGSPSIAPAAGHGDGGHAVPVVRSAAWIWFAGVAIGLALLTVGLWRMAWIAGRCEPVIDPRWILPATVIADRLGVRTSVELLQSPHDRLLVTWGVWRPRIILPAGAAEWTDERIRIVLCHELSHVRRRDGLLQIMSGVLRSIYWFNPLIWIACRRLRHESERACDDDVINFGMTGHEYAPELLDIARTLRRPMWAPAPAMARPSSLQRRVSAMLNAGLNRNPLSGTARGTIAAAALSLAIIVAGSSAAAQAGAALSGSFVDALNNAIPDVSLTLTNNQSGETYTVRSDVDGQFSFDALPDGEYQGLTNAPGFTDTHPYFRLANGRLTGGNKVIPLALGSVEETVTVSPEFPSRPVVTTARANLDALRQRMRGQAIVPPLKIQDVRPLYPPNRTSDDATVFLEGVIDTNGLMKGLQVLQPADADFAVAAKDAVERWQFTATELRGVAVDTAIRITVRFVH